MNDQMIQRYNQRVLKDRLAKGLVTVGGISIIVAIMLIFFYLLQVVIPMFESAAISQRQNYAAPGEGKTLVLGLEEQGSVGVTFTDQGLVVFFDTGSGEVILHKKLDLPAAISTASSNLDRVILGLENGTALVLRYGFETSYPENVRTLRPVLEYPLGEQTLVLDESGQPLTKTAFQLESDGAGLAAFTADNKLVYSRYLREESFMTEEITTELQSRSEIQLDTTIQSLVLAPGMDHLYVATRKGVLVDYPLDMRGFSGAGEEFPFKQNISTLKLLLGGASVLVGLENGEVQQWMQVRMDKGADTDLADKKQLTFIRTFLPERKVVDASPATSIATEQRRKGFAVANALGEITLYYSTSHKKQL